MLRLCGVQSALVLGDISARFALTIVIDGLMIVAADVFLVRHVLRVETIFPSGRL
jgi:hypothetical protein